jgi:hypothetical protein
MKVAAGRFSKKHVILMQVPFSNTEISHTVNCVKILSLPVGQGSRSLLPICRRNLQILRRHVLLLTNPT